MMYIYNLIYINTLKELKLMYRYGFNTLFSTLIYALVFIGLLAGLDDFKFELKYNFTDNFLSGYIVWVIMISSFSSIISDITGESSKGTLEQLYLNSKSFCVTLLVKGISSFLITLIQTFILITIIVGVKKDIDPTYLYQFFKSIPILIIGLPSIWGLSFIIIALTINYKNVSFLYNAISSMLFAFLSYQVHYDKLLAYVCPGGITNLCLQNLYSGNNISMMDIIFIIINSVVYLTIGILFFRIYEYKAKKNGKFSKY